MGYCYQLECKKLNNKEIRARLDPLFTWEDDGRKVEVLKSAVRGSVYYAAIRVTEKPAGAVYVTAEVCITRQLKNGWYYDFGYKSIPETHGPYYYTCPPCILDLLTETDNENALQWRAACRSWNEKEKRLHSLPVGSFIRFTAKSKTTAADPGDVIELEKVKSPFRKQSYFRGAGYKWPLRFIPSDFQVLKNGIYC